MKVLDRGHNNMPQIVSTLGRSSFDKPSELSESEKCILEQTPDFT